MFFYSRFAIVLLLMSCSLESIASFDRLFTTYEQRELIDLQRSQNKKPQQDQTNLHPSLHFGAMIRTEKGYVAWINGTPVKRSATFFGIVVDPQQINSDKLVLKTPHGIRKLGLGQVYWVKQDKVVESYEKP